MDRLFRWLPVAAIPVTALVVFGGLYKPVSDPDTFWHLRLGTQLASTWTFQGPEPWTALASRPLVLHEWAPELLYAAAYRLGGIAAVAWIQAAGGVLLLVTLYLCSRRFAPPLVASAAAAAGFIGAAGSVAARPQMVTFIFLALTTTAWMSTARDTRGRWWLVPLSYVWACSHAMWFLGVGVGVVVIAGMVLDRTVTYRAAARLAVIPGVSVLVAALTPVGPSLLLTAGGMRGYTEFVTEWGPPSLLMPQTIVTVGLAMVVVVVSARSRERTRWTELALLGTGVALSLMSARTVAVGAVILTILAASVVARHVVVSERRTPSRRLESVVLAVATIAVLLVGPVVVRTDVSAPAGVPLRLDSALGALPAGTVVFNDYVLGGWLLWAHPELDPVIDGRADVYDIDYFRRTVSAYSAARGWDSTVRASHATAALLPPDGPLAEALRTRLRWRTVGEDNGYALLVPPA